MTTTDTPPEAPETPEDGPATGDAAEPVTEPQDGPDEPESFDRAYVVELRDEAAQHRVRARDLEAERDQLRERLLDDNVRHLTAAILADPGDLTVFTDPTALVDDEGYPDPDAILAAARQLATHRPHLASRRPAGPIDQGARDEPGSVDLAGMLRERAG